MSDVEKVAKALEEVIAEAVYPDRPRKFMMPLELAEEALALLKAQEAKPPVINENSYGWKFYYCPSCGKEFYQNNKFSFCEKCGQAVKWE